MAGYYKNPEATEAASKHGWHHTGDVGYLDEDGYLFIVDRLKDMIITGGFNVYSAEVEQALMQHPAVRDCAVVGLPDDKWGERVTAVIEPSAEVQPDELVAFVKARIGSVKAPKQVELWQELPRSRVGKVLKADVRTQLLHDQGPRRPWYRTTGYLGLREVLGSADVDLVVVVNRFSSRSHRSAARPQATARRRTCPGPRSRGLGGAVVDEDLVAEVTVLVGPSVVAPTARTSEPSVDCRQSRCAPTRLDLPALP